MDESILKAITVLYAEDDDYIRMMVARFLKRRVAKVFEAVNGKEGLNFYLSNKDDINLVITDIQMPVMNGLAMIEEILKLNETQPIIITTAYGDEYVTNEKVCRNIIKPIDNDELIEAIMSCLSMK